MAKQITTTEERRTFRVRKAVRKSTLKTGRLRLTVFRSTGQIYAQVIDDNKGVTVAAASTVEKDVKAKLKNGGTVDAAAQVGKLVAERATKAGIKQVVFDRGSYMYHGRIKALAEGAGAGGLDF